MGGDFEEEEVETCDNIDCERRERNPVCGMIQSKTQVYVNACTMRAQSCALTGMLDGIEKVGKPKNGKCKTKTKPKEQFSMFDERFPVFGLNRFGREAEEDIDCTTAGPCDRRAEGMRGRGVCGSDGNTYASVCLMRFISCQHGKRVTLSYNDACDSPCATNPTEVDLQCATNGLTFWNKCAVEEFNYLLGNSQLFVQIAYPGPCMDNRQMANDYVEEQEIAEIEEDQSDPYSFEKCRQ